MTMRNDPKTTLIDKLVDDLSPARRLSLHEGLLATLAALVFTVMIAVLGIGLRSDLSAGHLEPMFLLSSGLFLMLAAAASYTVIEMSRPYVGGHRDGWVWAVAMTGLLPVSATIVGVAAWWHGDGLLVASDGWKCSAMGIMLGIGTAAALTIWLRRGAPTSPERAGLLTGLAAGSIGIFAFSLHCPHNDISHIGIWHGLTVGISALIGKLVVPLVIRW